MPSSFSPLRFIVPLAAAFISTVALHAQANITWNSAAFISGDSDATVTGSLVWAYNLTDVSTNATVNGVTFTGNDGTTSDLTFTTTSGSAFQKNGSAFSSENPFYTNLSAGYQTLLQSAVYWDINAFTTPDKVTLNGLVSGNIYYVSIWVNDSRSGNQDRVNLISDGNSHDVTLRFNDGTGDASLGQFVTGTFTATGSTQDLDFSPSSGDTIQLNAIILSTAAIPEPATCAAFAGLCALGLACFARSRGNKYRTASER